jgi:hypothetical protein
MLLLMYRTAACAYPQLIRVYCASGFRAKTRREPAFTSLPGTVRIAGVEPAAACGRSTHTEEITMIHVCQTLEEAIRLQTGEANRDAPHLVVPFYMPLEDPVPSAVALRLLPDASRSRVERGKLSAVAVAAGSMCHPGDEPYPVQFVLLYGTLEDGDTPDYWTYETVGDEYDLAVLMDGDGMRHVGNALPARDALAFWMGGFLGWSEKVPGLFRLRYAEVVPN